MALLQPVYPGLSAVEGGHDFGRDGDIYFTIEGRGGRSRIGRLLATIGDPRENARIGLFRMREEGLSADVLVVATSTSCQRPSPRRPRRPRLPGRRPATGALRNAGPELDE